MNNVFVLHPLTAIHRQTQDRQTHEAQGKNSQIAISLNLIYVSQVLTELCQRVFGVVLC